MPDFNEFHELSLEVESDTNSNKECNIVSKNNTPTMIDISDYNNENNLWKDLQMLIITCNIPHCIANQLLCILKKYGHMELPNDVRALLRTPRNLCILNV